MLADVRVHRPADLDAALALLADAQGDRPTVLAGGTDLMVVLNSRPERPSDVVDIWGLDALRGIEPRRDGSLYIGALTTFRELIRSPLASSHCPALIEAARTVGAAQIQSRATLGGNVANASPAGDSLPVLLAQGTKVLLRSAAGGQRTVPFDGFYAGYRQPDIRRDELIVGFRIDPLPRGAVSGFRKVGTRLAQAISKVVVAGVGVLAEDGTIAELRLAAGSVAPVPVRLLGAEQAAIGHRPEEVLEAVAAAARADVVPIDDIRSTADYRREVTGRLVARFVADLATR